MNWSLLKNLKLHENMQSMELSPNAIHPEILSCYARVHSHPIVFITLPKHDLANLSLKIGCLAKASYAKINVL